MSEPATLLAARLRANAGAPRPATLTIVDEEVALGVDEAWRRSGEAALALQEYGVTRGSRVAIAMATSTDVVIAVGAVIRLGATLIPLPIGSGGPAKQGLAALRAGGAHACLVPAVECSLYLERLAEQRVDVRVLALEDMVRQGSRQDNGVLAAAKPDDGLLLQFSSGTTGSPKGIYLTQGNVAANLTAASSRLEGGRSDHLFSWLPLFHDLGLVGSLLAATYAGSDVSLMSPGRFIHEPLDWLVELSRRRATITAAPQFAYDLCLSKAEKRLDQLGHLDLSSVRCMINGAEMVSPDSCREFERVFGRFGLRRHSICPAYGMAENCVMVAMRCSGETPVLRHFDRRALAAGEAWPVEKGDDTIELIGHGPPAQGVEVLVRGPDGSEAEGRVGEICVGGTSAAACFVDEQGSLSAVSDDGFVSSGDLGFVLDGELYCIGRSKEVFNHGGRSYSPIDIERELLECEGVSLGSVAVFSVTAPAARDELVVAVAAQDFADGDFDALAARIRRCVLREFRFTPSEVVRVDFLPRTSSGKVRRGLLRDLYARGELGINRAPR